MRREAWAAAAFAVLTVVACKGKDAGMSDDLAKDVAAASSDQALSLAPSSGSQAVVSAEERAPEARPRVAMSSRAPRATPHRTPHRERVAPRPSPKVAEAAAPTPAPEPVEVAAAPAPSSPAPSNDAGVATGRPHPADIPASGGSGSGEARGSGSGIGIGEVIGAIGISILRGGTVDGDHCDPRSERRHGGMGGISVNDRLPIPNRGGIGGAVIHGGWYAGGR